MKKKALLITCLFVLGLSVIVLLYFVSGGSTISHHSFYRFFPKSPLSLSKNLDLKYDSYYLAGASSSKIYLGNVVAPLDLLISNYNLTDTQHVRIRNEGGLNIKASQISIDSPNIYITDLHSSAILKSTLEELNAKRFMYDSAFFAEAVALSHNSFVIRIWKEETREFSLAKETQYWPFLQEFPDLLEKQMDGIFSTDGMLHFNSKLNRLVYVYFYRNQFICMDTSLNLIYRRNTIDTISQAHIKVAEIKSNNSLTLAAPPLVVNKKSCTSEHWLFVNSGLLSKNENKKEFRKSSVIDVYKLLDGEYQFSFYLPDFNGQKIRDFKVFGNQLVAIHNRFLVIYRLDRKYFKKNIDTFK